MYEEQGPNLPFFLLVKVSQPTENHLLGARLILSFAAVIICVSGYIIKWQHKAN